MLSAQASKIHWFFKALHAVYTCASGSIQGWSRTASTGVVVPPTMFDVYEEEPLGMDSRFMKLDHTILIPHLGGASLDVVDNHSRMITADLERFLAGQKPLHLVNPAVLER